MVKNNSFKKFITYLIVASYILTLVPVVSFAADTPTDAVIYDAYISGNFVTGETITANYSFDNPDVDADKTEATIKWYSQDRYGNKGNLSAADGTASYTITSADVVTNVRSIFFTVTPTDASGNAIGKTEFSNYGTYPFTKDSSKAAVPEVRNATIVPLNPQGTTMVGDTLAARFSYREISGTDAGEHKYQWYSGNSMSIDDAQPIEGATEETYTVDAKDSGKWIFVKITPVSADGSSGTTVAARTHLGNVARLGTATVAFTGPFRGSTYSRLKFLADTNAPADHNNKGPGFSLTNGAGAITVTIDAGMAVPFNGFYVKYGQLYSKKYTNVSVTYSNDGTNWSSGADAFTIADGNSAEKELIFNDKVRYARYFRLSATVAGETAIHDFYPFVSNKALPKIGLAGDEEVSLLAAPDAASYDDAGYVLSNVPSPFTADEIKEKHITKTITDKDGNIVPEVVTTQKGEFTVYYTLAMPGLDKQEISRKVIIGNGQKTPGNLCYYYEEDKNEVTYTNIKDVNSIEGAPAINDGNPNTVCEIEVASDSLMLPASAVVEVKDTEADETYVSQFAISEATESVTSFNIYVSTNGTDWGEAVYSGSTIGEDFSVILPSSYRADYVKLEITSAEGDVRIKDMEVFLDDDTKILMAKELILNAFEAEIKNLAHKKGYIYKNIPLQTEGIYGTKAKWTVDANPQEAAEADNVNGELKVVRQDEETELSIKLMVEFIDEDKAGIFSDEYITKTLARKSTPKAIDVHIKGNFVMGQTLTIPDGYYYDEAGVPEDKNATQFKWYRANKWGSTAASSGYLSANLPSTTNSYTIVASDVYDNSTAKLFYDIYVSVTPASMADDDAKMGKASFSPLYSAPSTVSGNDAPTVVTPYVSTLSKKSTMMAGDTVAVHYAYINRGEVEEGATSYRWQARADINDAPEILTDDSPKNTTYTLTENEFGKWIECVITPVSKNGTKGTAVVARNYYGNAFLDDSAASYETSGMRGKPSISSVKVMAYHEMAYLYGSDSGEDKGVYSDAVTGETRTKYTAIGGDAGSVKPFNAFYLDIGSVAFNDLKFYYKLNADDEFTEAELATDKTSLSANGNAIFELKGGAKLARYFKVRSKTASGYSMLYGFFPCLTENASATIEFPEDLRVLKGDTSFDASKAFTSAKDAVGNDVDPVVSGDVDINIPGEYDVTYSISTPGDAYFPEYSVTKTFEVIDGMSSANDEAYGKKADVSCGSGAENLTDGNPNTAWTGEGTAADIIVNLGEKAPLSSVTLDEDGSNISEIKVYVSDNGTSFSEVEDLAVSLADGKAEFSPVEAKYVKISLTYSDAATVKDIQAYASSQAKATIAASYLSVPEKTSDDIALPTNGKYDTSIVWESSKPDVISTEGSVTQGKSDVTVTLTAKFMDGLSCVYTKEFDVKVAKKESSGGQGSSGGGSSSGGGFSSGFGVSGPAPAPLNPPASQQIPYKNFSDVPDSHWASQFVNSLAENGIVSGRSEYSFEPEAKITRAEFLKLIVASLNLKSDGAKADFADVSENDWFYSYVAVASSLGIAKGTDGKFNPNEPILRRDMAVLAKRALDAAGKKLTVSSGTALKDIDSVADYAKEAVEYLSGAGIINGNENSEFMPDKNATRAETAKIIYMLLK